MSFDRKKRDSETQGRVNEFGTVFQKDLDFSLSNPADVLCDCSGPTQFAVCPLFQVGDNGIVSTPIFCTPNWVLLRKRDNITHFCTSASFHITGPQEKSLISTKEICII